MKNFLELVKSLFGKGALSRVMGTRTNIVRFPNQESQRFITTDLNIEAASDAAVKQAYKYAEELFPSYPQMNDAEKLIFEGNLRRLDNAITDRGLKIKELEETQLPSAQLKNLKERLEKKGEDLKKTIDEKKSQSIVQGAIDDFLKTEKILDDFDRTGYVRATVRQIMREDIQAGKLKLPKELENQVMQGLGEPIDIWRRVYGEGALEQIDSIADDLSKLRTEVEAAQMARSKFKFEPDVNRPPGSYTPEEDASKIKSFVKESDKRKNINELGEELNVNVDKLKSVDEDGYSIVNTEEYNKLMDRNEEILRILKERGVPVETKPKIDAEIIPFKKKPDEPEKFAMGGNVESKGLDYLMGLSRSYATGGRVGFAVGTPKKILDLIAKANKALSKKKSMESMNPKTGELTIPKDPIKLAEEPKTRTVTKTLDDNSLRELAQKENLNQEEVEKFLSGEYNQIQRGPQRGLITRDKEGNIIIKDKYSSKYAGYEQATKQRYDDDIIKAADEIFPNYDDPRIAADQIVDSYAQMKFGLEDQYGLSDKQRMDLYRQAYDYVMDYNRGAIGKTAGKSIDISDEATAKAFTDFVKENDPEGFKKIQKIVDDINNKNALDDFDVTGRKPNASGGLNYLMGL